MIEGTTINRPSRTENALPNMAITAEIVIPNGRFILLETSRPRVVNIGFSGPMRCMIAAHRTVAAWEIKERTTWIKYNQAARAIFFAITGDRREKFSWRSALQSWTFASSRRGESCLSRHAFIHDLREDEDDQKSVSATFTNVPAEMLINELSASGRGVIVFRRPRTRC